MDLAGAEARCEQLADGGNEGPAVGEEGTVDVGGRDFSLREELVYGIVAEMEVGLGPGHKQTLGVLDRFVETIAEIVVDEAVERLPLSGFFGLAGERAEEEILLNSRTDR